MDFTRTVGLIEHEVAAKFAAGPELRGRAGSDLLVAMTHGGLCQ